MSRMKFWPDPVLTSRADPIEKFDDALSELILIMLDEMYLAYGRGLSAPQIGVLLRVFVMDASWKDGQRKPRAFVNPKIIWSSENTVIQLERCLSIPDQPRRVARPETVRMTWQDCDGAEHEALFTGFQSACVQHEVDHLNGIVLLDHPEAA